MEIEKREELGRKKISRLDLQNDGLFIYFFSRTDERRLLNFELLRVETFNSMLKLNYLYVIVNYFF